LNCIFSTDILYKTFISEGKMANGNDTVEIPWSNGKYDITHPDSQQPDARVSLSGLPDGAFKVDRLSLQAAKADYPNTKWLSNYQLTRKNGQDGASYTVEITLASADQARNATVWLYKRNNATQVSGVSRQGTNISFQLRSDDPSIGIS
jgi:hypothetical protein